MDRYIDRGKPHPSSIKGQRFMSLVEMVEVRRKKSPHYKDIPMIPDRPHYLEPLQIRDRSTSASRRNDRSSSSKYDDRYRGRELVPRASSRHARSRSRYDDDDDDDDDESKCQWRPRFTIAN